MCKRRALLPAMAALWLQAAATSGEQTVVADDPFSDGDISSATGGDALGLAWLQDKLALKIVDGDPALGDGKALHFKPAPGFAHFTGNFPEVPLAVEGDLLIVEFDYRLPKDLPKVSGGLRLGVYDSHGTRRTKDAGFGTAYNDDSGYGISSNAGGGGDRESQCFRETAGNEILGGPAPGSIQGIGERGPCVAADGGKHHFRLELKRGADGALSVASFMDEKSLASATETADKVLATKFDEFALGFAGKDNGGEITLDNFKVTATTQQPLASMQNKMPAAAPVSAAPATTPGPARAFRLWTNQQGRQVEAALLAYDAKAAVVKLQLRDGREYSLPINGLSPADVAFVSKGGVSGPAPATASSPALASGASTTWSVAYPEPLKKMEPKLESGRACLRSLRPGHPRLMMLPEDWAPLKELVGSDPLAKKLYAAVRTSGTEMLDASPLQHVLPDGKRLLPICRQFIGRMYTLGMLHYLDGDPKWSARAIKEMLNVSAFADWNPAHFLDVAEMGHGMAVGYDWFYSQLSASERTTVRKAILEKALTPGLEAYAKPSGWHRGDNLNNWNQVCNGGLMIAALAIADEDKKEAQQILEAGMTSLQPAMHLYQPDGAWEEGPGYWEYATNYVISAAEALRTATGSDGGIGSSPALNKAAEFMQHDMGASGKTFNFADGGAEECDMPALLWLGRRFQRPDCSSLAKSRLEQGTMSTRSVWFAAPHCLMWFDRGAGTTEWMQASCDRMFRRIEMVTLRTNWEPAAWSISAKGGDNRFNHGDLDLGTFVLDAMGSRWAMDLGADNYGLEGYFSTPQRYTHSRTSSAGQNTLTWDGKNQELDGTGFIETFESTPDKSWSILNLSKGYSTAKTVRRGIMLVRKPSPSVLIQDEVEPHPGNLVWCMHTQAKVNISGAKATLEFGGRQLAATILQPAGATFQVEEVTLEPPAFPTPDTRKLLIKLPVARAATTIAVRFSPVSDSAPPPSLSPLAKWGGKSVHK
jgi:hypothetical protein